MQSGTPSPEGEPDLPSVSPESEAECNVSNFQRRCADACCKDPDYASYIDHCAELDGLWDLADKLVVMRCGNMYCVSCVTQHTVDTLVSRNQESY